VFIGHYAAAFAARAAAPRTSLGTMFLAAGFIDLLWPTFLMLGIEQVRIAPGITAVTPLDFEHYPFSHSLLAVVGWAAAFALVHQLVRHYPRGAVVAGLCVVSHWVLDAISHRPDLPLYPGGDTRVGLGLWYSVPATLVVESALFVAGLWLYLRATARVDGRSQWPLWTLVAFLLLVYAGNLFGTAPPSVPALAWVAQAQWLLVAWGYWVERCRA
jgi:hypothetical protein